MFFFNDTATTEIYTLSLHDALPIYRRGEGGGNRFERVQTCSRPREEVGSGGAGKKMIELGEDRKSTRLNSSHANISYAVFCLKKKTTILLFVFSNSNTISTPDF